jgi:predicted nucleic acid-binding protein
MIFWDSSALVALIMEEPASKSRLRQLQEDPVILVWWGTPVECESAIQRRLREGVVTAGEAAQARQNLAELARGWLEVQPTAELRQLALRLLRTYALRAADALQLAAAVVVASRGVSDLKFASADLRLNEAAEIENLAVLP